MARIPQDEYATILRRVDVDKDKVADVAASYECTPANIYNILKKTRAAGTPPAAGPAEPGAAEASLQPQLNAEPVAAPVFEPAAAHLPEPGAAPGQDQLTALSENASGDLAAVSAPRLPVGVLSRTEAEDAPQQRAAPVVEAAKPAPKPAAVEPSKAAPKAAPRSSTKAPAAAAARSGKPGYGLVMRTSDGEEAVHPFRSLDELLSAAKPILRTAARSPEPIWFSIQQVDLESLEESF